MTQTIYRFGDLPSEALPQAGGKGASLARMAQARYPVPDGLIILATAFQAGHLAQEAQAELCRQLKLLRGGDPAARFAVRSSALSEDSAQASFAGEFETVLNVEGDAGILAAVDRVLDSAHAERVQSYSQTLGAGGEQAMAVVVQRMVQPDFAGVLFTADPINGSHAHLAGNYVRGLGEQLVSGEADAQDFRITRLAGKYTGPREFKPFAGRLRSLALKLEKEFGCALDIEWAVARKEVFFLQARPITTLQTIHYETYEVNESLDHNYMWTNNNIGEALPDVMTPLTWSLTRELDEETQKISGYYLWSGNICGRAYSNVSLIFSFMGKFGMSLNFSKKLVGNVFGNFPADVDMPVYPFGYIELLKDVSWRGKRNFARIQAAKKNLTETLRRSRPWCEETVRRIDATRDTQALLALWTGEIRPYASKMWANFVGGASDTTLLTLLDSLMKLVGESDANSLLSNIRAGNGLESLGPLVGIEEVMRGELSRAEYLAKYGHRSPHEFELSIPYPLEDPGFLDRQIEEYRVSGGDVAGLLTKQREQFAQAKERFLQRYPSKKAWLENKLDKMSQAAQARESLRSEFTRAFRVIRWFMLKVGELTGIGADIFFVYTFELPRLLSGDRGLLAQLPARKQNYARYCQLPVLPMFVKGRFDPFEWAKQPDRRSDYYDQEARPASVEANPNRIVGFAGASGVVEGRVRVLANYDERAAFQPGEILVTSTTNVGWTPLFPRAAAIVTDIGAPLSHAAIVARELGIPAVVGCGNATQRLQTGDWVRVDGGQGVVEIISRAGAKESQGAEPGGS